MRIVTLIDYALHITELRDHHAISTRHSLAAFVSQDTSILFKCRGDATQNSQNYASLLTNQLCEVIYQINLSLL